MKRFAFVMAIGLAAVGIALWPAPERPHRPRSATLIVEPPTSSDAEACESDAWTRFATAAAARNSSLRAPATDTLRARLSREDFRLQNGEAGSAVPLLGEDLDDESMFRLARELDRVMLPSQARLAAAILQDAPKRAVALHALLGRREVRPEIVEFFLHDSDPSVRATAAFLLQETPEDLPAEVLEAARANISGAPDALKIESMELLAAAGLSAEDARLIASDPYGASNEVRIGAARALAAGHADSTLIRPLLEGLAADSSLSQEARQAAAEALKRLK